MIRTIAHVRTDGGDEDKYLDKLAKYIPGEIVAGYVALAALATAAGGGADAPEPNGFMWVVFVAGIVGAPAYLAMSAQRDKKKAQTRWWAYLLAAIVFVPWALAASAETRALLNVTPQVAQFMAAFSAFAVPVVDFGFQKLNWPRPQS